MADKSKTIIVRKVRKGHAEHHGGSWKVAYADFVTAMMAFFLLLWLISMVTPDKRASVADYFRNFNVFQQAGRSFMEQSTSIQKEVKTTTQEMVTGEVSAEAVQQKLKLSIDDQLKGMKDQVLVDVVEGGLRIQLVDAEGKPLFNSGSSEPNERGREMLRVVAANLKEMKNRIAVEGHTDGEAFRKGLQTNWELSTARASAARRELEGSGVNLKRVARVVGYADTELLVKDKPSDPRNRRISIIMLYGNNKTFSIDTDAEGQQALPVLPPSGPEIQPEPASTAQVQGDKAPSLPGLTEGERKQAFDPGIRPEKPIDIKQSIIPGIGR